MISEGDVELTALGVTLSLDTIYADTDTPPAGSTPVRVELDHDHA